MSDTDVGFRAGAIYAPGIRAKQTFVAGFQQSQVWGVVVLALALALGVAGCRSEPPKPDVCRAQIRNNVGRQR